jgi:hypothetical protein
LFGARGFGVDTIVLNVTRDSICEVRHDPLDPVRANDQGNAELVEAMLFADCFQGTFVAHWMGSLHHSAPLSAGCLVILGGRNEFQGGSVVVSHHEKGAVDVMERMSCFDFPSIGLLFAGRFSVAEVRVKVFKGWDGQDVEKGDGEGL